MSQKATQAKPLSPLAARLKAADELANAAQRMFRPTKELAGDEWDVLDGAMSNYWQAEQAHKKVKAPRKKTRKTP